MTISEMAPIPSGGSVDKLARYKWTLKDVPGQYRLIDKAALRINGDYQRESSAKRIAALRADWSWVACGALIVGKRRGAMWVIDGQHRLLAAMARSDIQLMPCLIFPTDDVEEEAAGFISANVNRKSMGMFDRWRALLIAGDQTAIRIDRVLEDAGVKVRRTTSIAAPMTCAFAGACYREAGADFEAFEEAIKLSAELCQTTCLREPLFSGLVYLHGHGIDLRDRRFRQRVMQSGIERLMSAIGRACAFYARGGPKVYATGILQEVNRNLQHKIAMDAA